MKNFARILKYTWKYRRRLFVSFGFALVVAALWGLNFTAVYPVLKILGNDKNLQQWAFDHDLKLRKDIADQESLKGAFQARLVDIETWQDAALREREKHQVTGEIARIEQRLDRLTSELWRHSQFRNHIIRHLPSDRFNTLAVLMLVLLIAVIVKGIFEFGQEYLVGSVMSRSLYDVRNDFYRKTIHQDLKQTQEGGSAELMSRFTNDTEAVGNGIKILYGRVIAEPLKILACLAIAMWISWQLTLLFVVMVPMSLYIMTTASRKMKKATKRVLERMSSIYHLLQETFRGLRVVKAYTMEAYERKRFADATREYRDKTMRVVAIDALANPLVEILAVLAVTVALLAGAYLVLAKETHLFGMRMSNQPIEVETLLQLYALLAGMADPVRKLSSVYTKLQGSEAASERVFAMMDKVPEVRANANGPELERVQREIEFRNICFSYVPEKSVLTNVSFSVRAGETIAIIGANGSGKSTLLNLLPRFYDPDYGSIFIDGQCIREANLRSLRKQIAIVTQDPILFDDTIYNNIRYGSRSATKEQIEEAAKRAFAHDFISKLPQGYETRLRDLGTGVSGGEKQRIALARAFLRDPAILILDEFSSAIDPLSETLIHEALKEFKQGRTTFLITHKIHTLEIADRIVVLDNALLVACGTHGELLATSELYRSLFESHARIRVAS